MSVSDPIHILFLPQSSATFSVTATVKFIVEIQTTPPHKLPTCTPPSPHKMLISSTPACHNTPPCAPPKDSLTEKEPKLPNTQCQLRHQSGSNPLKVLLPSLLLENPINRSTPSRHFEEIDNLISNLQRTAKRQFHLYSPSIL